MKFLQWLLPERKSTTKSQSFSSAYPIQSTQFERDKNKAFEDAMPTSYKIICIRDYETPDVKVVKGTVSNQAFGRPILLPKHWRKMTLEEVIDYKNGNFIKTEFKK